MLTLLFCAIGSDQHTLFEKFYYEYRYLMYGIAVNILKDTYLAEDAVSEAFWRIARNFTRLTKNLGITDITKEADPNRILCPQMKNYAVIVVKNVCYSMLRKSRKENLLFTDNMNILDRAERSSDYYGSAEDEYIRKEQEAEIISATQELNETLSHTMYLHIVLGFSVKETAEILECSYETAKKRIQRGRAALRRKVRQ